MNIKYNELSIVGKIWTLAQLHNAGIKDNKKSYVNAAIRKLEILESDENVLNSLATGENSISNILRNITDETPEFVNDNSVVSLLWYNRAWFDDIKNKIKDNNLSESDLPILEDIYLEIKRVWVKDLKERKFSSVERRDLFKIKEEIEDVKIKVENRVKRNQINLI